MMAASLETRGRSSLSIALALSVLLHALALALLRERAAVHWRTFEGRPTPSLQTRLRPEERRELSAAGGQAEKPRVARSRKSVRAARKPVPGALEPVPAAPPAADATVPAAPPLDTDDASTRAPVVDLEAARRIAREVDRARERSLSELPPPGSPASDPRVALARGMAQAARADCHTAHAGKGLLAIPFLIFDAATDSGCKW
jgi:hypothetical protein